MSAMGPVALCSMLPLTRTISPPVGNIPTMNVRKVAELINGLQDLGCTRTTGEDQTVCVMSDSFNALGNAEDLQASGDLPHVQVVKVCAYQRTVPSRTICKQRRRCHKKPVRGGFSNSNNWGLFYWWAITRPTPN